MAVGLRLATVADEAIAMNARFSELQDELHASATRITGLADFGVARDYLPGLQQLLRAFDTDCRFSAGGRQFAYGTVLGTLIARLYTQEGWKRQPQYRQIAISRPLVITGVPRTGTTALHKLLSMDTQFQGLEHWLSETPMVRPPRASWPQLPEYRASVAALEAFFKLMPEMRKAHDIVADEVDECLEVLRQSFVTNRFASGIHVPSYDRWFLEQDERGSYRHYADVLRLIGAAEPDKRWLLKNPGHIAQAAALFEIFPDACVVQTHRDPVKALPSLCSTLLMSR
ncbi:MAG: sulfotransferase, partial [Sinobacteraceae bacterium]|nr:sulfotransferase [Nevskiaceae bacterium]